MKDEIILFAMILLSFTCLFILVTDYNKDTPKYIHNNSNNKIELKQTGTLKYSFYNYTTKEVDQTDSGIPIYENIYK